MTPPSITLRLAGILLLQCFHTGFSSPPAHFSPKDGRLHECEHILTSDNGLIATDNWPSFFAPGYKCRWVRTLDTAGELTIIPVYLDFNESGSASACPDENFIEISVSVPDTLNTPEYRRAWNCRNLHTGLGSELKAPVRKHSKLVLVVLTSWWHQPARFLFKYFVLKETPAEDEGIPTDNSPSRIIRANNQVHQHGFLMSPNFPHPHNKLVLLKWTFHGFWNILFYLAEFDVGSCEDFDAHVLRLEIRKSGMDRSELMKTWCGDVPKGDRHKWVTGLMSEQPIYLTYAQRRDKGEQPWAPSFSNTAHVTHKGFLLTWIGLKDPNLHSNAVRLLSGEDEHQTVNNTEKDPRDIYFVFIPSENGNAVVTSMLTDNDATTCGAELMEYYIYWRPACYVMFNCSRDTDPRYKHHIYWKEQFPAKKNAPFLLHVRFPESRTASTLMISMFVQHPGNDLFNAALGKPTVFSVSGHRPGKDSTKDNLTSDLVVDGKAVDGYEDLKSGKVCAQTVVDSKRSNKTMWYVDLGKVYRVHWIHIVSRRNVSNNHMKLFYVELTRTVTELNHIQRPPPANITCFTHRDKRATSDIWISCPHDTQLARYVGITFYRRTGNMQLCEVEVQVPRDPEEDPDEDCADPIPEYRGYTYVSHTAYRIGKSSHYKPLKNCTHPLNNTLNTTGRAYVQIHFTEMDIEESVNCIHDYVQILGKRYCGFHPYGINEFYEVDLNNTTPEIRTVSFVTDGNIEGTGFKLWYRVTLLSDLPPGDYCGNVTDMAKETPDLHYNIDHKRYYATSHGHPKESLTADMICEKNIPIRTQSGINLVKVNTVRINDRDVNETGDENPNSAPDCLGNMLLLGSNRRYRMFCGDHFGAEGLLLNLTGDGGTDTSRLRWIRRQKPSHAPYRLIPQNKTVDIEYFHTPDCGGEVKVHRDLSKVWNISSPMYPLFVPPLLNCTWRIVPDFKGFIRMDVVDDDFDETGKTCETASLQIRLTSLFEDFRYCGQSNQSRSMLLSVDEKSYTKLEVVFVSDSSNRIYAGKGFLIKLHVLPEQECGGPLSNQTTLTSTGYPQRQHAPDEDRDCVWTFYTDDQYGVFHVTLDNIGFPMRSGKCVDYVEVKLSSPIRGHPANKGAEKRWCGSVKRQTYTVEHKRYTTIEIKVHQSSSASPGFYNIDFRWEKGRPVSDELSYCGWSHSDPLVAALKPGETKLIQIPRASIAQQSYENRRSCTWNFRRENKHVKLSFRFLLFQLENAPQCLGDRFTIFARPAFYCGDSLHGVTVVGYVAKAFKASEALFPIMFFESDNTIVREGFIVHITQQVYQGTVTIPITTPEGQSGETTVEDQELKAVFGEDFAYNFYRDRRGFPKWDFLKGRYADKLSSVAA